MLLLLSYLLVVTCVGFSEMERKVLGESVTQELNWRALEMKGTSKNMTRLFS